MRVKTRRMWIPRPTDWNAPPGIATSTSAAITAARYPRRYGHRDAGIAGVGCAVAVAKISSYGAIGAGSIASSSIGLPAAKNRYGVAAAFPRTTAHARPGRLYQVRNRYPRMSVVAVRIAAETIDGATCFRIRTRVPKIVFRKIGIDARPRIWSAGV